MPGDIEAAQTADHLCNSRLLYDKIWSQTRLARPERFNTWPIISRLIPQGAARLEIGPGLRPRLPISGTHFIDISPTVIERLNSRGALAQIGDLPSLPFQDSAFDLVCAFDIIEHVQDDLQSFSELTRVLKDNGILIFSVPIHAVLWNSFDEFVGHVRRYEPAHLMHILQKHELVLEKSAIFDMQPASLRLLTLGLWLLINQPSRALFWYNWVFLPLGLLFQKKLKFSDGLVATDAADEIVLVCRKSRSKAEQNIKGKSKKRATLKNKPSQPAATA
jgi:SAM-dependent methyltransferase